MLLASVMACLRIVVEELKLNVVVRSWHRPYGRDIELALYFSGLDTPADALELGFPSLQFWHIQLSSARRGYVP